jgi:hypothetical protein
VSRPLAIIALLLSAPAAYPWTSQLQGGGEIVVDPDTRRPVFIQNGVQTQLWDGVHRLDDGSVVTVKEGRVVPTQQMLDAPSAAPETDDATQEPTAEAEPPLDGRAPPPAGDLGGASRCEVLVLRMCGADRRCSRSPACLAARQLGELEREERIRGAGPEAMLAIAAQCEEAAASAFFEPCP